MASRRTSRIIALMALYEMEISPKNIEEVLHFSWYDKKTTNTEKDFARIIIKGVLNKKEKIDVIIKNHLKVPFSSISCVNLCILRISVYCLIYENIDYKVTISEALGLVNQFEVEKSVPFINAILDSIHKKEIVTNERKKSIYN